MRFALAGLDDAESILEIVRQSASPLLPHTPLGSPGAATFIRDIIGYHRVGADKMWIGAYAPHLVGIVELRLLPQALFLNQIYIANEAQGHGVGKQLLGAAIDLCWHPGATSLILDVLENNDRALRWYERLGLLPSSAADWSLEPPASPGFGWFSYHDLHLADAAHRRYGFSMFQILTEKGSYSVGRLQESYYRIVGDALLADSAAVSALHLLDPERQLLLIRNRRLEEEKSPSFASTLRMHGSLSIARDNLK